MRENRTSSSMRGRRKRAIAQRACALLYQSPWLVRTCAPLPPVPGGEPPWRRRACDLIGEKLLNFADAAEQRLEFARELPPFLAEVWRIFNRYEIAVCRRPPVPPLCSR